VFRTSFQDLWAAAVEAYEDKTGIELDDGRIFFTLADSTSVADVVGPLEDEMKFWELSKGGCKMGEPSTEAGGCRTCNSRAKRCRGRARECLSA